MKITNRFLIGYILGPIGGTADYDQGWEKYKNVNGNDEETIKKILQQEILPYYESRSNKFKEQFKWTLSFYLTTGTIDFEDEFDACLIAFDPPDDPKLFFIWLWELLFPDEGYMVENLDDYKEEYSIQPPRD
jgi:hypothetical protein